MRKGKKSFVRFVLGGTLVKINKWGHKKVLSFSCREGPYRFVWYVDGNGDVDFDERSKICIIKDVDEQWCECLRRDIGIYHINQNWLKMWDSTFLKGEGLHMWSKRMWFYTKLRIQCEKGTSTLTWTKDVEMWMKNGLGFGDIDINFLLHGEKL